MIFTRQIDPSLYEHVVVDIDAGQARRYPMVELFGGFDQLAAETYSASPTFCRFLVDGLHYKSIALLFGKRDYFAQAVAKSRSSAALLRRSGAPSSTPTAAALAAGNLELRIRRRMSHRKVYLLSRKGKSDRALIFGSANASPDGIAGEQGEVSGFTRNPALFEFFFDEFERVWNGDADPVAGADLDAWVAAVGEHV